MFSLPLTVEIHLRYLVNGWEATIPVIFGPEYNLIYPTAKEAVTMAKSVTLHYLADKVCDGWENLGTLTWSLAIDEQDPE